MTSSAKGRETEQLLREALQSFGGSCAPGELTRAMGISERTVRAGLERLARAGEIVRSKSRIEFTLVGRAKAAPPAHEHPWNALDVASAELLPQWHAAFARLLADAVVARRLFPERRLQPSFVAYGPARTAKSTVVAFVIRALGIDDRAEEVLLSSLARGELLGRRMAGPGGRQVFEPSPHLGLRLLCLDEFTTADGDLRRESLKLLQGDPQLLVEGSKVRIEPTVVVLFNPQGKGSPPDVLSQPIYRRAITLDTATVRGALQRFDTGIAEFHRSSPAPVVDFERLVRSHEGLPQEAVGLLRLAGDGDYPLTEAGREVWDVPKLELCALGRAARWSVAADDDLRGAAAGVLIDALTCAETVTGWVQPDWRDGIVGRSSAYRKWLGDSQGGSEILARVDQGRQQRSANEASAAAAQLQSLRGDLITVRFRAELVERLSEASRTIERVPPTYRVEARGIREVAKRLRDMAGDARSLPALEEIAELARQPIGEAESLRSRIDTERLREQHTAEAEAVRERERRDAEARIKADAKAAAAEAGRQRRAAIKHLRSVRSRLAQLKARRKATSPSEVVTKLVEVGVIREEIEDRSELLPANPIATAVGRFRKQSPVPAYRQVRYRWIRTMDGRYWRPSDFAEWTDEGSQAALDLGIAAIDRRIALCQSGSRGIAPITLTALGTGQL